MHWYAIEMYTGSRVEEAHQDVAGYQYNVRSHVMANRQPDSLQYAIETYTGSRVEEAH